MAEPSPGAKAPGAAAVEAVAEALRLAADAPEGFDLKPVAVALGRELARALSPDRDGDGADLQLAAVLAQGALMALPARWFEILVAMERARRGAATVGLGLHDLGPVEAASAACALIDGLPEGLWAEMHPLLARHDRATPASLRRDMAALWLRLPMADRGAFLDWAAEAMAA